MTTTRIPVVCICMIAALSLTNCKLNKNSRSPTDSSPTPISVNSTAPGVEKVKPASGTGNVQGVVLYNSKPAENIEVKLCEKFNQYFGGCGGKTYTARTDKEGEYVICIYADDASVTSPYIGERVDDATYDLDKPLAKGTYRWQVTAYNSADKKLSESSRDIKFTILDGQ